VDTKKITFFFLFIGFFFGFIIFYVQKWGDLGLNIVSEIVGISITVLLVDRLIKNREEQKVLPLKKQIYKQFINSLIGLQNAMNRINNRKKYKKIGYNAEGDYYYIKNEIEYLDKYPFSFSSLLEADHLVDLSNVLTISKRELLRNEKKIKEEDERIFSSFINSRYNKLIWILLEYENYILKVGKKSKKRLNVHSTIFNGVYDVTCSGILRWDFSIYLDTIDKKNLLKTGVATVEGSWSGMINIP
jgi:hypothetical protein